MLNKLESKEPGPAPCTREGMKVHQRWNYFIVKKKDMAVICKLRTDTTNLLEIDTARTLSARSSTLYQTPMRRMTTTGSEKRDWLEYVFTQDSLDYFQTICTFKSNNCDHDTILKQTCWCDLKELDRTVHTNAPREYLTYKLLFEALFADLRRYQCVKLLWNSKDSRSTDKSKMTTYTALLLQILSHKSVQTNATKPIGIMGSDS